MAFRSPKYICLKCLGQFDIQDGGCSCGECDVIITYLGGFSGSVEEMVSIFGRYAKVKEHCLCGKGLK